MFFEFEFGENDRVQRVQVRVRSPGSNMLVRMKLQDEGISRYGRNTRLNENKIRKKKTKKNVAK